MDNRSKCNIQSYNPVTFSYIILYMTLGLIMWFQIYDLKHDLLKKFDKLDFIKIKFYFVKDTIKRVKGQATDCKKIFAKVTSDKGL